MKILNLKVSDILDINEKNIRNYIIISHSFSLLFINFRKYVVHIKITEFF